MPEVATSVPDAEKVDFALERVFPGDQVIKLFIDGLPHIQERIARLVVDIPQEGGGMGIEDVNIRAVQDMVYNAIRETKGSN